MRNGFHRGKTENKMQLKEKDCLDPGVRVDLGEKRVSSRASENKLDCTWLLLNVGLKDKLVFLMM